ncbi:MAG TPA: fibronectin type III domain-containing protein [Thermoanaerobaculia bacterium]|nr:fibronectin type III domain-containing protein [Thermoanaerobaculia bacterium]
MRQLIWSFTAAVLLSTAASAQPFFFGDPAPLTTTRYESRPAQRWQIVTNGTMPYLVWSDQEKVRITPITTLRRVGRPLFQAYAVDAVWTGAHFVVAGQQADGRIVGRLAGADGEAIGETFTIAGNASFGEVRLAFDGSRVLLLYGGAGSAVHWLQLSRDGLPIGEPQLVPIDVTLPLSIALTARAGEFLVAIAGKNSVAIGSLKNTEWNIGTQPAAEANLREVTIAANATQTLTIWTNSFGPLEARTASTEHPGQIAGYTLSDTSGAWGVAASWDGKDFIYTYDHDARLQSRYFNAPFPFASASGTWPIDLVSVNGKTYAAYPALGAQGALVARDVATGAGDAGAFSAAYQSLRASTASATAALFTWVESSHIYAGVRTSDGNWFERRLATDDRTPALAASDGRNFVIVHYSPVDAGPFPWSSTMLDPEGRILGNGPEVSFFPTDIAWTGTAYVVVGTNASHQVVASLLSPAGTITAPTILAVPRSGRVIIDADVAVREGELLVAWTEVDIAGCPDPAVCGTLWHLLGARFTPLLQRNDAQSLVLVDTDVTSADVIWDGTRYVIAWSNYDHDALRYRTLRTNSAISGITTVGGVKGVPDLTLVPNDGVATTAADGKIVYFRDGGDIVSTIGIDGAAALEPLGNRLAYVQSIPRDEAPYHGAPRLNLRVGDLIVPGPKPSAPVITRAVLPANDVAMIIEWTKPLGPVNGYRVEYRVDDGVWNELDVWFDARATQLVIRPWRTDPVNYYFRVRAVNDAGFGPYSQTALVRTRKVRAVR